MLSASRLLHEQCPLYPSPGWNAARAAIDAACPRSLEPDGAYSLRQALEVARNVTRALLPPTEVTGDYWDRPEWKAEDVWQAAVVRDIFPFRPVTHLPAWRTSTVIALAEQMYDARDFSAMPILADAHGDAGCEDEAILPHCRGPSSGLAAVVPAASADLSSRSPNR